MFTKRYISSIILLSLSLPAASADFKLGDEVTGKISAVTTAGTMVRTESADPAVYGSLSSARVATPAGQLGGTAGSSDLNFQQGRPVSTVVKTVIDLELQRQNLGVFVRTMAWHDFELAGGGRAYGNSPNGFQQNVPLSDNGFAPEAKFSNILLADVYAFGKFNPGDDASLDVRVGRQVVSWGGARFITGGINVINPADYAAQQRPGALPQESKIPEGMVYANLVSGKKWGIDGFVQYEFRPAVAAGCGTFLSVANYAPSGCNYVSVLSGAPFNLSDPAALSSGRYPKRFADENARDSGQYGLSLRYGEPESNTEYRVYAMNYHSRSPSVRVTNANVAGGYGALATTRLTDPNGLHYAVIYPEDIQLYGSSFKSSIDASMRAYGEIAFRPNQPLNLNTPDLVSAFVTRSPNSALNLSKNVNAIAPGGTFDGYDRFNVATASIGSDKMLPLGVQVLKLSGEIGISHVYGLPDPGLLRYGRADDFGTAAINGIACVDTTAAQKSCAHDGFITTDAWGYRLNLSTSYPDAFFGAALTPSLSFNHDVRGYSYDGTFLQDRKTLRPGIRADWRKKYYGEIQYTHYSGGTYNLLIDRDNVTMVVGASF